MLRPPTTDGTEHALLVFESLPMGLHAPVVDTTTGLGYCRSVDKPVIGEDEQSFPTSALLGVPTVAVGVEPGKYPLPALVMVTRVIWPKVGLPVVVSTVATAVAVTAGFSVLVAIVAVGVPAQYTFVIKLMFVGVITTGPVLETAGNRIELMAPIARVTVRSSVHLGPVIIFPAPSEKEYGVPVHAPSPTLVGTPTDTQIGPVNVAAGGAEYGPFGVVKDTPVSLKFPSIVKTGAVTAVGDGGEIVIGGGVA